MSTELQRRLLALGETLELPAAPDVVPAVMARVSASPRRRHARRRALVVTLAALLLLAGAAMAAAPTRHTILRILGLRGVRIERVSRLPPLPARTGARLGLGRPIPLASARHAAGFTALLPPGSPAAFLARDVPGGRISLVLGRVLIIEFRGRTTPFIFKVLGPGTTATRLRVNGGPGVYLAGAPHEVLFQDATGGYETDRVRLAGNVLMWQQGPVTLREEGVRSRPQALALARSLR